MATALAVVISVAFIGLLVGLANGDGGWTVNPHIYSPLGIMSSGNPQGASQGNTGDTGSAQKASSSEKSQSQSQRPIPSSSPGPGASTRSDSHRPPAPLQSQGEQTRRPGKAQGQPGGSPPSVRSEGHRDAPANTRKKNANTGAQSKNGASSWRSSPSRGRSPSQAMDPDIHPKGRSRVPGARSQRVYPTPPVATPNPGMRKWLNQFKWGHGEWGSPNNPPYPQPVPQQRMH